MVKSRVRPGLVWIAFAFASGGFVTLGPAKDASDSVPPIREFDPATTSRLGIAIFEQDQLAWVASDVLTAAISPEKLQAENMSGWVADTSGSIPLVRFVRGHGQIVEAGYDVLFRKGSRPELVVPKDRVLSNDQAAKVRALQSAETALHEGKHPWCGGKFNTVVLADPETPGWLVYFLRAKPAPNSIPVGGHYRMSVSSDGRSVKQVDQLFASCLTMDRKDAPSGSEMVGISMSHVVSSRPLETHVFLSLQEKLPFYVITLSGVIWQIEGGKLMPTHLGDKKSSSPRE